MLSNIVIGILLKAVKKKNIREVIRRKVKILPIHPAFEIGRLFLLDNSEDTLLVDRTELSKKKAVHPPY